MKLFAKWFESGSGIVKRMDQGKTCEKCNSDEINVVNSFAEKVYVECRVCNNVNVLYSK